MSFQGDVAGLGLGELLQGLARGGREGVLTLYGAGLSATLGVENGQLHLLPEADEDPEVWRKRCGRAWPDADNERVDSLRMAEIAYAGRLERMFELLDCEGVHFRFEPGPLPNSKPPADEETGLDMPVERAERSETKTAVYCPPISVEFLLLEHARLSDECGAHGDSSSLSIHEVPCPLVAASAMPGDKLFAECDGYSNVVEVSDRLSWPLRQTKAAVLARIAQGCLRLATANELAALTRTELVSNRFLRAASRLSGWAQNATPGVPDQGEAELLIEEWNGGKLVLALAGTSNSATRTVLRRMELAEADPKASLARWREICKHHRHDMVAEVHVLRLGLALEDESLKPGFPELLKVARYFQEQGRLMRAGAMLIAAATRNPESTQARLELGNRMLSCGLVEQATPWLLEACRALLHGGLADKAVAPLRALVAADPTNRDARSLYNVTRSKSTQGKAKSRNLWIVLACMLILGVVAVVRVHKGREVERQLLELEGSGQRPEVLLRILAEDFPETSNEHALELKRRFTDAVRARELAEREAWLAKFNEVQAECENGDPLLGLQTALDLIAPPKLTLVRDAWPTTSDLLQALVGRMEQSVGLLGLPELQDVIAVRKEQALTKQLRELISMGESRPRSEALDGFQVRARQLLATLRERDEQRAQAVRALASRALDQLQEQLLATARAQSNSGDLDRAAQTYRELLAVDETGRLTKVLEPEIQSLEAHRKSVAIARELAAAGKHDEAIAELNNSCKTPWEHVLPWRLQSRPSGARVRFADGTVRSTPCEIETAPGEALDLTLELPGYEPCRVHSSGPRDTSVVLSLLPQRWWRTSANVAAVPVALEDDHVLVDRAGNMVRLTAGGAMRWQLTLESLSGIARAPVFLPGKQGALLCLTEDGNSWIVEGSDGHLEGPWSLGSPPIAGPYVEGRRVRARFANGREAVWENRLKPEINEPATTSIEVTPEERSAGRGSDSGMAILRRSDVERGDGHDSPWSEWTVNIETDFFVVREREKGGRAFFVRRQGDWSFIAWEAPHSRIPLGRVWISDGAGVRAFEP